MKHFVDISDYTDKHDSDKTRNIYRTARNLTLYGWIHNPHV